MYSIYDIEIKCNFYGKPYASHASNCSYSPHARSVRDHKSYVCAYMSSNATPSVYRQERVSISLQCVVAWSITSGEAADCAGCSSDTVYPVIRPACRIAAHRENHNNAAHCDSGARPAQDNISFHASRYATKGDAFDGCRDLLQSPIRYI